MLPVTFLTSLIVGLYSAIAPAIIAPADDKAPSWVDAEADAVVDLNDADGDHKFVAMRVEGKGNIEPGGPWLGLQFGPVSKPLATQLKLQPEVGQVVLNVMESSPADAAGFQQYDVITHVDGKEVSGEIHSFLDVVRGFAVGQTHTFTLLRGGQNMQVPVAIGARPEGKDGWKPKFPNDAEEMGQVGVFKRSGMLEKDDQGNWTFKNFNLGDLPNVWHAMPNSDDLDFNFNIALPNMNGERVLVHKSKGQTLRIETDADGKITVSRTEKVNGQETTTSNSFANKDELKAADADAFKVLDEAGEGCKAGVFMAKPFGSFGANVDLSEAMKSAQKAGHLSEEALAKLHEKLKNLGPLGGKFMFLGDGEARTSFETLADAKIRVTTRSGEEELVQTYDNAEALKAARPDLHKKFEKLEKANLSGAANPKQ
jgi:hypothetical protein